MIEAFPRSGGELCAEGVTLERIADAVGTPVYVYSASRIAADFDALDGQPTTLFFLLGATSSSAHLRLMAKVALMLRLPGMTESLTKARSRQEVIALFMKAHEEMSIRF